MRLLFLHSNTPDYLSAGLFHGLRSILGTDCVDLPRFDCMYKPLTEQMRSKIRGNGFTLYGLLDDYPEMVNERFFIWHKNITDFDYYVIADIWNQWETYIKLIQYVPANRVIVIDPSDSTRVFPFENFSSNLINTLIKWHYFKKDKVKYFKREIPDHAKLMTGLSFMPNFLSKFLLPKKIHPISFSIPSEKITKIEVDSKSQLFTTVIVDAELSEELNRSFFIPVGEEVYKFSDESEYFKDIQLSKFGITTKRSGWDCLRHYEYAANGTVLCFKNLNDKYAKCAPHGLNKENCLIYKNTQDLMDQINHLSSEEYNLILQNSYKWVQDNSTLSVAQKFIASINFLY